MTIDLAEIGNAVAAMEPAQAKRCGNCEYGAHVEAPGQVRCEGLPPTPLILGANQTPAGLEPKATTAQTPSSSSSPRRPRTRMGTTSPAPRAEGGTARSCRETPAGRQ